MTINYECNHCNSKLETEELQIGDKHICRYCKKVTYVGKKPNEKINSSRYPNQNVTKGGYFSFQNMISSTLIKVLYVLGLIAITIGGGAAIIGGANSRSGEEMVITGLLALTFGNVFWRIFCEGIIVIFSLHETTVAILKELNQR